MYGIVKIRWRFKGKTFKDGLAILSAEPGDRPVSLVWGAMSIIEATEVDQGPYQTVDKDGLVAISYMYAKDEGEATILSYYAKRFGIRVIAQSRQVEGPDQTVQSQTVREVSYLVEIPDAALKHPDMKEVMDEE